MNAWMAFVSIIAMIAIVLIAGGLIAFLGHMIIGAFDSDKKGTNDMVGYNEVKQLTNTLNTNQDYDFQAINYAKAEEEKKLASNDKEVDFEDQFKFFDDDDDLEEIENKLKNEAEAMNAAPVAEEMVAPQAEPAATAPVTDELDLEDDDFADLDDLLDEISTDVVDEEKVKNQEENAPKMSDTLAAYSLDAVLAEENAEEVDEVEEVEEDLVDFFEEDDMLDIEDDEPVEPTVEVEDEEPEIIEEIEEVVEVEPVAQIPATPVIMPLTYNEDKQVIEDLKAQLADLNRQLEMARNQKTEVVTIDMTEEECLARLAELEERLKGVKKEYKVNMKEYKPLKKVMTDLDKYQTKLRRKETQVAKKKVSLYGVNNYVDIDKEKAEKLANELDLLEGLRLSVSHCEEVINANKDRFPILEHTNKILEDQISHIEADIQSTNLTLQKIREKQGNGSGNNDKQ